MDRRLKGRDKCISVFFFAIIGKRQHMHVLMFRKEARNATFFIALWYVSLAKKIMVLLCRRAGRDSMI